MGRLFQIIQVGQCYYKGSYKREVGKSEKRHDEEAEMGIDLL